MINIRKENHNSCLILNGNKIKLLPVLLVITMLLSACGGLQNVNGLYSMDYFTKKTIKVPLSFNAGVYGGISTSVYTNDDFEKITEKIRACSTTDCSYDAKEYAKGRSLITIEPKDGDKSIAILVETTGEEERQDNRHRYTLFNLDATFGNSKIPVQLIFPFHLLDNSKIQTWFNPISMDEKYRTGYSMDDFIAFYKDLSGIYPSLSPNDIQVSGHSFTVNGKYLLWDADNKILPESCAVFSFTEENGQNYFSVHLYDSAETDVSSEE